MFKNQIQIYSNFDELIQENMVKFHNVIYLYGEEEEELKKLKNSSAFASIICNCDSLISFAPKSTKEIKQEEINPQAKKLERACVNVLKKRFQNLE